MQYIILFILIISAFVAQAHVGEHNLTDNGETAPETAKAFAPFKDHIGISWDDDFVYIEGNGLPQHKMMTGITAWQQQVPLPHNFTGAEGAFRIPRDPEPLEEAQELTLIGPIAIAVNGIPIFHSLTQSGKDAKAGGELDAWGGHCGRADDYHYHIAPGHLEAIVGVGNPVAYGLDGFPVYMANPAKDKPLDEAHGYFDDAGKYRYVSGNEAPYMMGMFKGAVNLDARPRTAGIRPFLRPLRGASITGFEGALKTGYTLHYEVNGQLAHIYYLPKENGGADFNFTEPDGTVRTEHYDSRRPSKSKDKEKRDKGRRKKERQRPPEAGNSTGSRQPWILVHAPELDRDGDADVTELEVKEEIDQVFKGFDTNQDGSLSPDEMAHPPKEIRSPLNGFIKQHNLEMDQDGNGSVSQAEMENQFLRDFERNDLNQDKTLTPEEYQSTGKQK